MLDIEPRKSMETVSCIKNNIEGAVTFHTIWLDSEKKMIGSALVSHENGCGVLWIITILEEYRKKKFGTLFLNQIKKDYIQLETQWLNPIGKKLCLRCGFDYLDEPNGKNLVWVKEDDDAGNDSKE